jgi:hypothetical protein
MSRWIGACSALVLCCVLGGCGGQGSKVTGTVTLDNAPLTTGTVAFYPNQPGPTAYGQIDGSGRYSLNTGTDAGLAPGTYTVTVDATELIPPTPQNPEPLPKLLTPERYRDKATSGIVVEVKPGSNDIPIELTSK